MPTFGSLFAGIGGIDLGLERAGWECRFQVEWDPFCQHVLAHHWPNVPRYSDITAVDWRDVPRVDLIAGGFPCQPFSLAGRRQGKSDDRWLWPAFADAIRALRPRHVLVENVPGLLAGHGGMGSVLGDLADLGYDAEWDCLPATAVGAPHLRYRVWIVAHATHDRAGRWQQQSQGSQGAGTLADPHRLDVEGTEHEPCVDGGTWAGGPLLPEREATDGHGWAGGWWESEPDVGRVAHGVPARVDRLRSLGNAVVPQVVEWIGRRLMDAYQR